MNLNIIKVGQANFTVFILGKKALIYDCGFKNGRYTSNI